MAVTFSENQGIPKLKPLQNVWKGGQDLESKVGSRRQEILSPFFFFFFVPGEAIITWKSDRDWQGCAPSSQPCWLGCFELS